MSEVSCHVRLVFLGGGGVGKTAIVRRFLFNTFNEKHRPTVEDLFFKEFNLGTLLLKVSKGKPNYNFFQFSFLIFTSALFFVPFITLMDA